METIIRTILPLYNKYRIESIFLLIALCIAISSGILFFRSQSGFNSDSIIKITESTSPESKKTIHVDIEGAVYKPDMYEIPQDSRLKDLIALAGGLTEDADQYFFARHFNLAAKLKEQEKIYIPTLEESESSTTQTSSNETTEDATVNINTASSEQLDTLTGVGPTTADKIISARPYGAVDELLSKKILGKSAYEKIKDRLVL